MTLQITLSLFKRRPGGGFSRVYAPQYIFSRGHAGFRHRKMQEGARLAKGIASKCDFQRIHSNGLALIVKPFTRNARTVARRDLDSGSGSLFIGDSADSSQRATRRQELARLFVIVTLAPQARERITAGDTRDHGDRIMRSPAS